jgi:hypothetical protein
MNRPVLLVTPLREGVVHETINVAKMFSRVAVQHGYLPLSPILHALAFKSYGEYLEKANAHHEALYELADCLWLYLFPEETLDKASFHILNYNSLEPEADQDDRDGSLRKSVYLVTEVGGKDDYVAAPLDWFEVDDLLAANLSQELRIVGL